MATTKKNVKLRKFPKAGTIGHIVLTALAKNPDLTTEQILPTVLKKFSESKFSNSHLAWYRHQVKVGGYILPKAEAKKTRKRASKAKPKAKATPKAEKTQTPVTK
jgi:hypothetical protein